MDTKITYTKQQAMMVKILWFAFFGVIAVFAFIAYGPLGIGIEGALYQEESEVVLTLMPLLAFIFGIFSMMVHTAAIQQTLPSWIKEKIKNSEIQSAQQLCTIHIVSFALGESVAIFGLVLFLLNGGIVPGYIFGYAFILHYMKKDVLSLPITIE